MRDALAIDMRPVRPGVALVLVVLTIPAAADRLGGSGGGGGGGRLGAVSSGMSQATGGNASPAPAGGSDTARVYDSRDYADCVAREGHPCQLDVIVPAAGAPPALTPAQHPTARFEAYAGAQLVYESTGSLVIEAGVTDRWFRFGGSVSRYFEDRMEASTLTMTMWSLTGGLRIDDGSGSSAAFVEVGAVGAKTRGEPDGDSSITGAVLGVRLDVPLTRRTATFAVAQTMYFTHDVRANGVRIGARYRHLEAAFRLLDFNVGPALFGPELGVRF